MELKIVRGSRGVSAVQISRCRHAAGSANAEDGFMWRHEISSGENFRRLIV